MYVVGDTDVGANAGADTDDDDDADYDDEDTFLAAVIMNIIRIRIGWAFNVQKKTRFSTM